MNLNFLRKKNFIFLLLPLVFGSLFLAAPEAKAFFGVPYEIYSSQLDALSFIDDSLMKVLLWLAMLALEASAFLVVSAALLDWSSTLPINLGDSNALVHAGWNFTAGLANMLFILIFIVIALAYIFKSESWGMKKALPRLLIIALLINFSLLLVKIFVDIGWIIQGSFIGIFTKGGFAAAVMRPVIDQLEAVAIPFLTQLVPYFLLGLIPIPYLPLAKMLWWGSTIINELITGAFSQTILLIIFSSATGFIFFIYAILFLVRIAIIWLLAIAAPLAFMAFILPATQKFFSQWFRLLLQWVFLGVVVFFLMGLGIKLFAVVTPPTGTGFSGILQGKELLRGYVQMIFLIVYLWVSFSMSRKFVPAGMNFVQSWAELGMKKGGKWTSEQTRKWGLTAQAGGAMAIAGAKRRFDERVAERTKTGMPLSWQQRVAKRVTGQVRPELLEAKASAARRELIKDQRNRLLAKTKDMDEEGTKAVLRAELEKHKRSPLRDKNKDVAFAELLTEKNALKDEDEGFMRETWKMSGPDDIKKNKLKRDALKNMLHWASNTPGSGAARGKSTERGDIINTMNQADIDKLSITAKENEGLIEDIVATMRSDLIGRLGSQSEIVFQKVQEQIKATLGKKWGTDTLDRKELGVLRNLHLSAATTNLNWEVPGSLQEIEDRIKKFGQPPKPQEKSKLWTPGKGEPEIPPKK